ncbi:MAG: hypothetical protein J5779_00820 [Clostridia bacterium]|nr:hypothetical protein [Clostridia bacterium]
MEDKEETSTNISKDWMDQANSKQGKRKIVQNVRKNYYLFRDSQTKGHGQENLISQDEGQGK